MKKHCLTLISTALLSVAAFANIPNKDGNYAGSKYELEIKNGVPVIMSDGLPVRGRMFYGAFPGSKNAVVREKWSNVSFEIQSNADTEDARLRMTFDTRTPDVYIRSVKLENLSDKSELKIYDTASGEIEKNFYANSKNYAAKQKDGVLHIQKSTDARKAGVLNFYFKSIPLKKNAKYKVSIDLKYSKLGPVDIVAFTENPFQIIGKSTQPTFLKQQKYAADCGVNFVTLGLPVAWDEYQLKVFDEKYYKPAFEQMIKNNPDVRVFPRLGLDPSHSWLDKNPDSEMLDYDGKHTTRISNDFVRRVQRFVSVSSKKYRQDASHALKSTIEHLESKYGKYIAGYHPCGMCTGEWLYAGWYSNIPNGYDKSTVKAWRSWLEKKYGDDKNLQRAWNKQNACLQKAAVPAYDERINQPLLIDPATSQNVIDFHLFLQDEMADTVLTFAKTIRESTAKNPKLSLVFYGYGFDLAGLCSLSPAISGHYGTRKVLESPYVDLLTGPISYYDRTLGGTRSAQSAAESVALAKKMWCDEDDNRTYLIWESGSVLFVADKNQKTADDSIRLMRRNMSQQILRNNTSWWMDLFGAGWYADPKLWQQMDVFKETELDMINNPRPFNPEVALIYDEKSICHVGTHSSWIKLMVHSTRKNMHRAGTPYGQYLLEDILEKKAAPKLNIYLACFALNKKQREQIKETAKNSASLFTWGTGIIDTDNRQFSFDTIKDATGFDVKTAGDVQPMVYPTEEGKKAGIPSFGREKYTHKLMYVLSPVAQEGDIILGEYSNGMPAVIMRKSGKYPQIFCGGVDMPPELYRYACREAGIHIYNNEYASVCANGPYITLSATRDGIHTVDVGTDKPIFDIFENKPLGKGPILKFDMKSGDVKLLKIQE